MSLHNTAGLVRMRTKALILQEEIFCPECLGPFQITHTQWTVDILHPTRACSRMGELYQAENFSVVFTREEEDRVAFLQIRPMPSCEECGRQYNRKRFMDCKLRVEFMHTPIDCPRTLIMPIAKFIVFA